jgi:hypothetical protein
MAMTSSRSVPVPEVIRKSDFSGLSPRSFRIASRSAWMSGGMSLFGNESMVPSRFVSGSTSTRNPTAPDSWIRQRALTTRTNSGSGALARPPLLPFDSPFMLCTVTGSKRSAR